MWTMCLWTTRKTRLSEPQGAGGRNAVIAPSRKGGDSNEFIRVPWLTLGVMAANA